MPKPSPAFVLNVLLPLCHFRDMFQGNLTPEVWVRFLNLTMPESPDLSESPEGLLKQIAGSTPRLSDLAGLMWILTILISSCWSGVYTLENHRVFLFERKENDKKCSRIDSKDFFLLEEVKTVWIEMFQTLSYLLRIPYYIRGDRNLRELGEVGGKWAPGLRTDGTC